MTGTVPTLAELRASRAVRQSLAKAIELAEAAEAAAREAIEVHARSTDPGVDLDPERAALVAAAAAHSSQAWTAIHAAAGYNGAKD